jgi:glycosyltransferase involved in cell wall biosynthesis
LGANINKACPTNPTRVPAKLKIGLVSTSTLPVGTGKYGGIEKIVYDFAEVLSSMGHKVKVAAPQGSVLPAGVELIPTVTLPSQQDQEDLAYKTFEKELEDVDVVHDFGHGHIYARSNPDRPTLNVIWDNMSVRYEKAPTNIVALSEWQRKAFESFYGRKARHISIVCANENRFTPSDGVRDRFLILGKMSSDKAIITAMAYCKLLNAGADVAGGGLSGDDPSYRHNVMRACDGNQFTFWGEVSDDVKIRLMQQARAVINPRCQPEAFWHVGIEAMLCGTPVIAYAHSSYPEIIAHNVSGLLCQPFNEGQFLGAMQQVHALDRKKVREFAMRYSRSKIVCDCVSVYKKVAEGERW